MRLDLEMLAAAATVEDVGDWDEECEGGDGDGYGDGYAGG